MSTQQQSTTDRIAIDRSEPTLTGGKWRADTSGAPADTPVRHAQLLFAPDARRRLYNLVDAENRAMF
ncbi:MAG: hypothetical protein ABEI80_08365 [Haloplanus sp.]